MRGGEVVALAALTAAALASFSTITNDEDDVDFVYPGQPNSERGLPLCGRASVCSTLHLRMWQPALVERLCRCPGRAECPWHWSEPPDARTMPLDNRSQLKFCESVANLTQCTGQEAALVQTVITRSVQEGSAEDTTETQYTAQCLCPPGRYWRLLNSTGTVDALNGTTHNTTSYQCSYLERCVAGQFCGHLRRDHYSLYHRCSCPWGHLCLSLALQPQPTTELLFHGLAYRSVCSPNPLAGPDTTSPLPIPDELPPSS
ncbi:kappa-scoloptoxin(11)-Ss1a-like [Bacillus rossius redtenbacheri]|uniref:kappa-scoloptoxin(11)-Ss1a-like n=1 Tax=Bacillus rossius redtenbacheri TaxID=93214 RepID=UPI002FDE9130